MNIIEELRSLDPRDPGRWPLPVLAGAVGAAFLALSALGIYFFVWNEQRPRLQQFAAEEQKLRQEFRDKHAKAVNLERLQAAAEGHRALLRRPAAPAARQDRGAEPAGGYLADRTCGRALQEKLFQPQPEQRKDFYAELPIKIRLTGSYHQFGEFVSGIAALPRIVTLHDIDIKPDNKDAYDQLSLELTAKTYRYLDEDEIAAGEADKKKDATKRKPAGG